jgi:hypothetical protein
MSKRTTIERLSDLEGVAVPRYPFQADKQAFLPRERETVYLKSYTLKKQDVEILRKSRATGDPPDIDRLRAFLAKHCNFVREPDLHWLTWPKIVAALKLDFEERPRDNTPPEQISDEARVLAIFADNRHLAKTRIAKLAGVHRSRLYEMPKFMQAYEAHREAEKESSLEAAKKHAERR